MTCTSDERIHRLPVYLIVVTFSGSLKCVKFKVTAGLQAILLV